MNSYLKYINSKHVLRTNRGFSTLFIVIIIGVVALSMIFSLSTSSVWSIRGSVDTKNANIAKALNIACAEVALETLRENNNYVGTENLTIDGNSCNYTVSNTGGSTRSIIISGNVNGVIRKSDISTGSFNPLVISSWLEVE